MIFALTILLTKWFHGEQIIIFKFSLNDSNGQGLKYYDRK